VSELTLVIRGDSKLMKNIVLAALEERKRQKFLHISLFDRGSISNSAPESFLNKLNDETYEILLGD